MFSSEYASWSGEYHKTFFELVLTQDKSRYDCNKKQAHDADGTCLSWVDPHIDENPFPDICSGYCEVRLTMSYGQEVPFGISNCQAHEDCSLNSGVTVTVTTSFSINIGIEAGVGKIKRDDVGANSSAIALAKRQEGEAPGLKASFSAGASWSWSTSVGYTQGVTQKVTLGDYCGYWTFVPYLVE